MNDDELLYIGKSKNIFSRCVTHTKDKVFNHLFVKLLPINELDRFEQNAIELFYPKYNCFLDKRKEKISIDWEKVLYFRNLGLSWRKTAENLIPRVSCTTLIKRAREEGYYDE